MRRLYTLLLYLLIPAVLLRLAWRGFQSPGYWRRIPERFGFITPPVLPAQAYTVWLHAVSVGEAQAAVPLVQKLTAHDARLRIVLTTMTPTGAAHVRDKLGDEVTHYYVPYDLPGAVRRFLRRAQPRAAIIMETELWPNIFHCCAAQSIPLVLANARMSERSARRYARVRSLISETLRRVTAIAAQSAPDAERIMGLGAPRERVRVTGSIKFDIKLPASLREQAAVLRRSLGIERALWIAASTHEGEEELILDAHAAVRQALPHSLLMLVPRHPERFAKVAALCRKRGLRTLLRSEGHACDERTDVFIGDSMGELPLFYAASDAAFVGGSLVAVGGHNLIEPAALGLPLITGPYVFNFTEVSRMLREAGAVTEVANAEELATAVLRHLQDANLRHAAGERGRHLVEQNRGALQKLIELLDRYLPGRA
ncbi:MAG: lipid IV(A) 3-deoxy-D-manno-octulosonic acid transferase [Gammaproteobacteria bacterium]